MGRTDGLRAWPPSALQPATVDRAARDCCPLVLGFVEGDTPILSAPGMFRIEPSSGIVRTTRTEYELDKTYRVFVQARDRTAQNPDKQDSEIAVLEVLAGDRSPQFVQQHYNVGVPEDTDVEAR